MVSVRGTLAYFLGQDTFRLDRGDFIHLFKVNVAVSDPTAHCSWTPEESQVESYEHQDNANIHYQPFPKSISEEPEIYTD
jgi:hypothetical protein